MPHLVASHVGEEDRYLLDVDQSNGFNNLSRKYSMGPAVKKGCAPSLSEVV